MRPVVVRLALLAVLGFLATATGCAVFDGCDCDRCGHTSEYQREPVEPVSSPRP